MRLFEFEAKALLKGYGIPIPSSKMARSVEEMSIERPSVLKAQIHDEPFFRNSGVPRLRFLRKTGSVILQKLNIARAILNPPSPGMN